MGGTFQATVGFQDSNLFQKAIKMALRCILPIWVWIITFQDLNFNLVPPMKKDELLRGLAWKQYDDTYPKYGFD